MAEQLKFNAYHGVVAVPPDMNWIYNVSVPPLAPTLVPVQWRAWKYDGTLVYNEQNIIELGLFTTRDLAQAACEEDHAAIAAAMLVPPPVLNTLTPNTAPSNLDTNVTLDGSAFDQGVVAIVTLIDGVTEDMQAPQGVSSDIEFTITVPAADIGTPGTVTILVENSDGKRSSALPFTST